MSITDTLERVKIGIAQKGLVLLVPVLLHLETRRKENTDLFIFKGEVCTKLREKGIYNRFVTNKVRCSGCKVPVNFDNLGMVVTKEDSLDLYCRNPGCTLKG
jgi:hypothetical protein